MKIKKFTALLLAVCMSAFVFLATACDTDNTQTFENPNKPTDNYPSGDYKGEDFTFMKFTSGGEDDEYFCGKWIDADEITGEAINDAIFKRNLACKEKYNVNIEERKGGEGSSDINQYFMSGDYCFDVIYSWGIRLGPLVKDGLYYDFRELDAESYIDLDASYWCPEVLDDLTIANRTFLMPNDITMAKLAWTECMFFNPQIIEDYGLENPHDLVDANEWTLDKYLEMVMKVHDDIDGDGMSFTVEDRYGMIDKGAMGHLLSGCGVRYTEKDADGYYSLAIGETKVIDLITKLREVLNDRSHVFNHADIRDSGADMTGYTEWQFTHSYFVKGHSLFISATPEITREFKDMESGYGVVPLPKYDSNQTSYCAEVDSCSGMFAIPNTCRNDGVSSASFERTGRVLEYLAYLSEKEGGVIDTYYDTTIKGQRQTIEKNKEMLDIVKTSGYYEWTTIMQVGGEGKTIADALGKMFETRGIASAYKQVQQRLTAALDEAYNTFANLD